MTHQLDYIIPGIFDGAIYALSALGLVLTYKTSGVFNFGQGAVAAFAAYFFYEFWQRFHFGWPLAALLTLLICGVGVGLVLERMAAYLTGAPPVLIVVATVGLLVAVEGGENYKYGNTPLAIPEFLPIHGINLEGVEISVTQIVAVVLALVAAISLYVFFKRSRLGAAMVAVVDDPDLLALQGISPSVVRRAAWIFGECFAAISGILLTSELGQVSVAGLILLAIAAFGAAAIGRFTNLPFTFIGGLVLGLGYNLINEATATVSYQTFAQLGQNLPFIILFAILAFVPARYFPEIGTNVARRFRPIKQYDTKIMAPLMGVGLVILCILPYITIKYYISPPVIDNYSAALGYVIIFMSLGLITWLSGQISLCHITFAAIGATTMGRLQLHGVPWFFALLLGGLICVPIAAIVAIPANRLSGIYVAILTFGFGILIQELFYSTFLMFGLDEGINVPRPHFLGLGVSTDRGYYFICLIATVLMAGLILAIRRARLGRLLAALSDSPVALDAHGTNTKVLRVLVFCISAFMAGIGGALIAGVSQTASGYETGIFNYTISLALVAVLAICGRRPIASAFLAAFLYAVITGYPWFANGRHQDLETLFFGVAAVVVACLPGISAGRSRRLSDRGKVSKLVGDRMSALHELPIQPARPLAPTAMYRNGSSSGAGNGNGSGRTGPIQPVGRPRSTTEVR